MKNLKQYWSFSVPIALFAGEILVRAQSPNWAWLGGNPQINSSGVYTGAVGSLQPGSRQDHVTVMDDNNYRMVLFGGYGYGASGSDGESDTFMGFQLSD